MGYRYRLFFCLLLFILTCGVFFQTGSHQFISLDDPLYVTENVHVKRGLTGENVIWAFTATAASNWHPLTWLSHMTDVQLFGLNPRAHHLTSIFIHAVTALLLFLLLAEITAAPWQSLFVAALFALHPLHVESVAWVAERKDVLSGFFLVLTILQYARHVRRPGAARYLAVLLCFAAGLMTKPMLVTLPVVLLLLDYWPLRRFQQDPAEHGGRSGSAAGLVREKLPFFLLAALSSVITLHAQKVGGAIQSLEVLPVALRLENVLVSYVRYLVKTVLPLDLALQYPFPTVIPAWQIIGSALLLTLISAAVLHFRRSRPFLVVGWCWFLVMLLPVIGIIQVGGQSMADRYTYLPLIGLFIMVCWGVPDLFREWRHRQGILAVLAGFVLAAAMLATWRQIGYWKNDLSLYSHTLQVTTGNALIQVHYANALADLGRTDEAIALYRETLRVNPDYAKAHVNLGVILAQKGDYSDAINHYLTALRIKQDYPLALGNLGRALAGMERNDEAIERYRQALQLDPDLVNVHLDLALLLLKKNLRAEADQHYAAVLRIDPRSVRAPNEMGIALAKEARFDEALDYFNQALRINPLSAQSRFNKGVALAKLNRTDEAADCFAEVLRLKPDYVPARRWLETLGR